MIQYKFAKNGSDVLVDIQDVTDKKNTTFFCLGCGTEMIARTGKIKVHHFAHKSIVNCSAETYLHLIGKTIFYNVYLDCLTNKTEFNIEIIQNRSCSHYKDTFGVTCYKPKDLQIYNITKYYDSIIMEKRQGKFIPDLLLFNTKTSEKLFIEIAVTHKSSQDKVNSNYKIIEINANCEDDFDCIKNRLISVKNEKVSFFNFSQSCEFNCLGNCSIQHTALKVFESGKCWIYPNRIKLSSELGRSIKYLAVDKTFNRRIEYVKSDLFKKMVGLAINSGLKLKNCFVCRYHAKNIYDNSSSDNPIFCKFLKKVCNSNEATTCQYYRLERQYLDKILKNDYIDNDFDFVKINQ